MAERRSLTRLTGQSLASRAKDRISAAIFEGRIQPEERLTIERIADELGISRTPVREALKALESDGVIRLLPRRGAIVASFSKREIHDRYTMRAMIEGWVSAEACKRQSKTLPRELERDLEGLTRLIEQAGTDFKAARPLIEANASFHNRILGAAGSTTAERLLEQLVMPVAYRVFIWQDREERQRSLHWHRRIVQAFVDRDPDAARGAMEQHLIEARDVLLALHDKSG